MGERVQPNIVGGLNTRLQLFMTYKVRRVISNDDIRLADIGAKKTALFLIISDDNASMQLLSSLLLSFLFKDLKEAFDAVGGEGRIPSMSWRTSWRIPASGRTLKRLSQRLVLVKSQFR